MDIRTKVAYACNLLSLEGHTDTIYGHVSARIENAEQVWMKPATLGRLGVRRPSALSLARLPSSRPWSKQSGKG